MRTTIITLALLLSATFVNAEGLNANGNYIKTKYPTEYKETLRHYAVLQWKDDFSMVVYEINTQADSLVKLVDGFKSENTSIAHKAIQQWSKDGHAIKNNKLFDQMKTFGLKDLLKMHCDWSMVKYEYDLQVKAKNSF